MASRGALDWLGRVFLGSKEPQTLVRPAGVAVDGRGTIVVSDPGQSALFIFETSLGKVRRIEAIGTHRLVSPMGVALDRQGRLLVTDSSLGLLARIDPGGEGEAEVLESFERPTGVAVHPRTREIFVVDTLAHQVFVLGDDLNLIRSFGSRGSEPGQLNFPTYLAFDPDGDPWVVDAMNGRIQRFDLEGAFLASVGRPGDSAGTFAHPKGIAFDEEGHLFVADALFGNVQIFERDGTLLLYFAETGSGPAQLDLPSGIAVDGEGRIFIADSANQRVQILRYLEIHDP
ncbi:MAG: hypothetical protein P1V51_01885 [Deltaproteobacteria bacterium]|nr:hypothetical protein [Deltaproteobacteria bacterium]